VNRHNSVVATVPANPGHNVKPVVGQGAFGTPCIPATALAPLLPSTTALVSGANRMRTPVWQPIPHFSCELLSRGRTTILLQGPPTCPSLDHLDSSDVLPTPHPHNVCICDWGVGTGRARGRPGFKFESRENQKLESGDEERRGMVRDRKGKENHHRLKDGEAGMTTTMDNVSEMRN
jgi:hypothetical protein